MAAALARELQARGHRVTVASMYAARGTWIEAELAAAGVPTIFLGKRRGPDVRMVWRLARAVAEVRPDLVHTHMYALKYAFPALWARRCAAVHTFHSLAEREADPLTGIAHAIAFRAGVVPVAIGEAVADSVLARYGARPPVIANGIPVADFRPHPSARAEVRAALGVPGDAPVFLMVGRFAAPKDQPSLIRAFSSGRLQALGAHLLLAGDGPGRSESEALARSLGVHRRVRFLGVRGDVPRLLAAAVAFVLVSRWEGSPVSVMEAMAAGRPVVATAVGCIPELVVGAAGRLVTPGDGAALEAALHALASDRAAACAAGTAAGRIACERFDVSTTADAYERVYARLVHSRRGG
jgi:glycosyltransferase involved in cell wall biosynthesis